MTYLVLARKWRPRSFDTLVGQDHVVRALTHALTTQRLHHAWLFTGTRGVGKTTLSRILAKSLNCETGITATPCGVCRACTEIDAGRYVDYLELDAASNRGVDEMTQLLEQAVYSPGAGRFKVYMIDEVHMLTGHAFNAMLKTLEEPPPHVKFILATTDPQKIPVTVLSRCLQFNLKQMPADAIVGHLQHVLAEEAIGFDVPALRLIGQAAGGSMRDALSLTDQAIAYSAGNLTEESVRGMLGTIDQRHLVRLLDALAAGQGSAVLAVADELNTRGLSYAGALADLAVLLSRVAVEQRVPGAATQGDPLAEDIARLATVLHPDTLQLFYSVAVHSRSELALAPDEYAGFVMACLRMLALLGDDPPAPRLSAPASSAATTPATAPAAAATAQAASAPLAPTPAVARVVVPAPAAAPAAPPQAQAAPAVAPAPVSTPAWEDPPAAARPTAPVAAQPVPASVTPASVTPPPVAAPAPAAARAPEPPAQPEPPDDAQYDAGDAGYDMPDDGPPPDYDGGYEPAGFDDYRPVPDSAHPISREAVLPAATGSVVAVPAASALAAAAGESPIELKGEWHALAARLPVTGLAAELARQSEWAGVRGRLITLRVAARALADTPGRERLRQALAEHFGGHVQLEVQFGETGDGTAHAVAQAEIAARQQAAETIIHEDPFVQALMRDFGAHIVQGTIRPVNIPPAA